MGQNENVAGPLPEGANKPYVTTTSGMRGCFAVLMTWDESSGYTPWCTGETCKDHAAAVQYAKDWARAEGIDYR